MLVAWQLGVICRNPNVTSVFVVCSLQNNNLVVSVAYVSHFTSDETDLYISRK